MPRDEDNAVRDAEFLERIPVDIRETFTDRQITAIKQAFQPARHGVDIRASLPLPGGRRYFVLLIGREQRSRERRRLDRMRTPLLTLVNVVTLTILGTLIFFFAVGLVKTMFN